MSVELTPLYRTELFLDAIVNSTDPPAPSYREEFYLAKIAGANVVLPAPSSRTEMYLAKIAGEDVTVPEPATREEFYLASLCGKSVDLPVPVYRIEFWLNEWAGGSTPSGGAIVDSAKADSAVLSE